jgi:hypothetical protein
MKIGFMVMIQKQSNNHHSGRTHNHQDQKWRSKSGVQRRAYSSFFFNVKKIVHHEFVPPTLWSSLDVLRPLRENVQWKRPELWCNCNWLLQHDNVPTHTSLKNTDFVTNIMVIVPNPSYSPDLAPCDFASFPKLKMKLKGRHFQTVSDIQSDSQAVLDKH